MIAPKTPSNTYHPTPGVDPSPAIQYIDGSIDISDGMVIPIEKAVDLWIEIHRCQAGHIRTTGIGRTPPLPPPSDEDKLFDLLTKRLLVAASIERVVMHAGPDKDGNEVVT